MPSSLSLVVALDENRLIGRDNGLPWRLPDDMKHFRRVTTGHTILMGRKTWDSLGRPLPERDNWVLTRDRDFRADGARVFHSLDDVHAAHADGELMVIGGGELYRQTLPLAQRLYLTEVQAKLADGDAWFPAFDRSAFREIANEAHDADERHAYPFRFITLERLAPQS
ncbi:dihydrofolate reductase [Solimonas marina]|uniref:Dihydrofolate reductase n=1 Tax=Solimonas marina TaxID=2714601 RepID=A0A970B9I9_9GAMM|nr:dihydrofolate reductase [Solimonas marina]NKF22431.1 dihydrofolate reductase [Solimonas marina]